MKLNLRDKSSVLAGCSAFLALGAGVLALSLGVPAAAQTATQPAAPSAPAAPTPPADPFPPANLKFFTADTPSTTTVESFLHAIWGFDPNRIWRVEGIQKTDVAGVSKVTVYADEKAAANPKIQALTFFVMPDGKHAIAGEMTDFGATPFADRRKMLQTRADGPALGASSRELEIVEFADLQCPHCKDAQSVMKRLEHDFPAAHIVYQSLPLVAIHPAAFQAAADGVCVAKHSNTAFFTFAQAVYDTQEQLTPEAATRTLAAAIAKAGLVPADIEACAATPATKETVNASIKLADEAGIDSTPTLVVNGRPLPLGGIPYDTLKNIILFQAQLDGLHVDPPQPTLTTLGK